MTWNLAKPAYNLLPIYCEVTLQAIPPTYIILLFIAKRPFHIKSYCPPRSHRGAKARNLINEVDYSLIGHDKYKKLASYQNLGTATIPSLNGRVSHQNFFPSNQIQKVVI